MGEPLALVLVQSRFATGQAPVGWLRLGGRGRGLHKGRARCKRIGCTGVVDFMAKAPGMAFHEVLRAELAGKPAE